MTTQDIRWQQRFANYERALARLTDAVDLASQRALSDLEKQGLIQTFEFTHELAWNVMKDYLVWQGATDITGSRDATRESFSRGIIEDGEGWMEMIKSRNQTSHTYNDKVADEITGRITGVYHALFVAFACRMRELQR
ncbi:MAG: nucleotidyltransferase substrate binding protein [Nitrospira sp.]|nr:nucleotidyltransferase substrate binding protein [Nitrospira sp.]